MVLLVVVVACGVLLGRGGDSGSKAPEKAAEEKETKKGSSKGKEKGETVNIGQPVTVADVVWTVTDAKRTEQLTQQGVSPKYAKTAEGSYVVVDFDFTNNGSDAVTLNTESLKLIDGQGRESGASNEQVYYVPKDRKIFLERINPGVTRSGEAIFEVAPGASGFKVQAGDAKMFTNHNGYIDLGF